MNENRRFTRSYMSTFKNNHKHDQKSKERVQLELRIKKAIAGSNFDQALSLINSVTPQSHWATCKRAHILFEMGRTPRALNTVRNAIRIQRNDCYECPNLLLKIIGKSLLQLKSFAKDIQCCLGFQNLPARIKQQLQQLLSQIERQQESARSQISNEDRQKIQEFTSYYETKGLLFKKVEIVQIEEEYRVARAKSTIKPHQIIIFVPEKQMITLEMAKQLEQVNRLAKIESKLKSPKHCMLSIFLLIHMDQGHNSPYYNYIQCLPSKLNNFPIYYSDQLLEELNGTYFLSMIKRKKADIEEDFKEIVAVLPELRNIVTYDRFIWARMLVSSRIFGVVINNKKTDALVPIADMLNHKIPKMTSWYFSDEKKGFVVQNSEEQIHKGHQIFDSYGYKCNSRFLLNYGFTMPQNSCNQVMIILKRRRGSKILSPNIKLTVCLASDQFKILLAYHRQSILERNRKEGLDLNEAPGKCTQFISNQNECEAWRMILQTMREQLQQYKTTTKMDEKLLRSPQSLGFNLRNCIEIRLGEKRVLEFYIKMSKKMIEYFSRRRKNLEVAEYETYLKEIQQSMVSSTE